MPLRWLSRRYRAPLRLQWLWMPERLAKPGIGPAGEGSEPEQQGQDYGKRRRRLRLSRAAVSTISETRADRYQGHSTGSLRARYTHTFDAQLAADAAGLDAYLTGQEEKAEVEALEAALEA
jgi:hypothetical protein